MKNLLAILAVLTLVTYFGYAQQVNHCKDQATGIFTFTVEAAIDIEAVVYEVDLGGVCPGCYHNYELGEKCLEWNVTGGIDCYWIISSLDAGYWPMGISHDQVLQIREGTEKYSDYALGTPNKMNRGWDIRKCVTRIAADCEIQPGPQEVTETVYVEYVCD